jgi:DNA-binding transcriptional ArsR family regulator
MALQEDKPASGRFLQFACDCVSHLHSVIRDPWSYVSRAGLISSETKEIILNKTYRQPKTVTQLASEIGLSQPAIYKHVKELLAGDMLREARLPDAEKTYRVEKYYEPNFPVLFLEDVAQLEPACRKVAQRIAEIYWQHRDELQAAFAGSSLEGRGYVLEDILDFLYSKIRRLGREILDEQGFFPELPTHRDGSRWVYWAEEIELEGPGDKEQPSS